MGLKIRGYFSVFGNVDRYGEIVDPGAFSDWLAEDPSRSLPIYFEHDHAGGFWGDGKRRRPVGVTTLIVEDEYGAYFEGELVDTSKGVEVGVLIEAGAARQASFGFYTKGQYELDEIWHLATLEPFEMSIVAVNAANDLAHTEPDPTETEEAA